MRINVEFSADGRHCSFLEADDPKSPPSLVSVVSSLNVSDSQRAQISFDRGAPGPAIPVGDHRVLMAVASAFGEFSITLIDVKSQQFEVLNTISANKIRFHRSPFNEDTFAVVAMGMDRQGSVFVGSLSDKSLGLISHIPNAQLVGGGFIGGTEFVINRSIGDDFLNSPMLLDILTGSCRPLSDVYLGLVNLVKVSLSRSGGFIGIVSLNSSLAYCRVNFFHPSGKMVEKLEFGGIQGDFQVVGSDSQMRTLLLSVHEGSGSKFAVYEPDIARLRWIEGVPLGVLSGGAAVFSRKSGLLSVRFCLSTPFMDFAIVQAEECGPGGVLRFSREESEQCFGSGSNFTVSSKSIKISSEDREYFEWKPLGRQPEGIVVSLHGGPHDCWYPKDHWLHSELASRGWLVIAPNLVGSSGYGEECANAIRGRWGDVDAKELDALIEELLVEHPGYQIALHGESYGAYLALIGSVLNVNVTRTLVVSPFSSPESLYSHASEAVKRMMDRWGAVLSSREGGSQAPDLAADTDWASRSCLIVYAEDDQTVPPVEVERLVQVGRSVAESQMKVICLPRGGHSPDSLPEMRDLREQMIRFITQ